MKDTIKTGMKEMLIGELFATTVIALLGKKCLLKTLF